MSDTFYTVTVIENRHALWDEVVDTSKRQDFPKKTTKFIKKGGLKREYNTMR